MHRLELPLAVPIVVARLAADERTARRLSDLIELTFEDVAVAAFEGRDAWFVEALFSTEPDRPRLAALVESSFGATLAHSLTFETLAPRDWVRSSLTGLRPVVAGRFFVHGSHDRARVPLNSIAIEIEAALAFGTGHHGTTRGCLIALDACVKAGRPRRVLDVGTGSGVLAIAAARALHVPVRATDIDPAAVRAARDNAARNHTAAMVDVTPANRPARRIALARARYDLILANILALPLMRLSVGLARLLAPGGQIVLSGLLPGHASGVIAAYRAQGLALERRLQLEGWVTLVMRRGRFKR